MTATIPNVVVIGGGVSGLRAAMEILKSGVLCRVLILSNESRRPYDRTTLSKFISIGPSIPERLERPTPLRGSENPNIEWIQNVKVMRVLVDSSRILLNDGTSLSYDYLVVASGVRPRRAIGRTSGESTPPVVRNVNDGARLYNAYSQSDHIGVFGAGVLGCELATAAVTFTAKVSLAASEPAPLWSVFGDTMKVPLINLLKSKGVHFFGSLDRAWLSSSTPDERECALFGPNKAWFGQGRSYSEVQAVGCIPNPDFLSPFLLCPMTNKVSVDRSYRVEGAPQIYAVGDVASVNIGAGRYDNAELWARASQTGRAAGRQIATALGATLLPDASTIRPHVMQSQIFGIRLFSVGRRYDEGETRVLSYRSKGCADGALVSHHYRGERVGAALMTSDGREMNQFLDLASTMSHY